ncbi:MAG: hypothetical protein ACRD0K_17515 [Egibacteraceae bacterium]
MTTMLRYRPAPIVDDATRRELLVGGLSLAALLAARGTQPAAGAEPEDGAFPVTIEHKYGSTEISAEPKRVVAVGPATWTRCWRWAWSQWRPAGSARTSTPSTRGHRTSWVTLLYRRCWSLRIPLAVSSSSGSPRCART